MTRPFLILIALLLGVDCNAVGTAPLMTGTDPVIKVMEDGTIETSEISVARIMLVISLIAGWFGLETNIPWALSIKGGEEMPLSRASVSVKPPTECHYSIILDGKENWCCQLTFCDMP